jgi:hypothetical protein
MGRVGRRPEVLGCDKHRIMIPRSVALPTLLAASVAVPYVASNAPQWTDRPATAASEASPFGGAPAALARPRATGSGTTPEAEVYQKWLAPPQGPGLYPTHTPLEGVRSYALGEVLRMDVTKEWIYQRWARKSTSTSDLELFGVRVPLVSGTQLTDVAGALTYYFDQAGQVQKLTFNGRTGDTTAVRNLVAQAYGLRPASSAPGEQLYQYLQGSDVISQLRTRPAPVLWESSPHDSYAVELVLQRPGTARPINESNEALQQILREQEQLRAQQEEARRQAEAAAAAAQASQTVQTKGADPEAGEKWEAFFPRSRITKPQADGLDKRRLYW